MSTLEERTKIKRDIDAAGICARLRNAESEAFALSIAENIFDRVKCQELFNAFHSTRPDLKQWEVQAIRGRAYTLARGVHHPLHWTQK